VPVLQSALGILALGALAWIVSEDRRRVPWRPVLGALALQLLLAAVLLRWPPARGFFAGLNELMLALERATRAGTEFVFGYLGGGPLPFEETRHGASFILAFRALPLILVVSALSALLFHYRVLPWVVKAFALALRKGLGVGGVAGVGTAANIFVGMTEAPLLVRPYLERVSRAELFIIMAGGMATIAGTVMVLYASILGPVLPDAMGHILTASLLSAPAAIGIALLMVPGSADSGDVPRLPSATGSGMDAVTQGTLQGIQLLLNVAAMLIVLVALVSLVNQALGWLPQVGGAPLSLERLLGAVMAPLMWLLGIPWAEAPAAGALMGTKTVLNEFVAYLELARLPPGTLSERSTLILTYALCGFANFGSLGIMIGGLGTMAPGRRAEVVALGLKSIVAGTLATCMTGAVVGLFTP